jgi:YidC/Oxa1 family membrane protein insertase
MLGPRASASLRRRLAATAARGLAGADFGCCGAASASASAPAAAAVLAASPAAAFPHRGWGTAPGGSRGFAFGRGSSDDGAASAGAATPDAAADLAAAAASVESTATTTATDAAAAALASFDPAAAVAAAAAGEAAALAAAKEGAWIFNSGFQTALVAVQDATGLPWWGAIIGATVAARTLMLPVVARQMRNTRKLAAARPEMLALQEWFKEQQLLLGGGGGLTEAAKHPGSQALVQEYQARLAAVWAKHDCHPVKSLGPLLVQAPLFIGFFSALRSLAAAGVPSLTSGGTAWFPNLAASDPTYGLPLLSAALFLATVEAGAADGMQGQDPATLARMKFFMRALAVGLVPLTASMPAGVFVYWATSNAYSLLQALALKTAPVRRLMGVPEPGSGGEVGVVGGAAPAAVVGGSSGPPVPPSVPSATAVVGGRPIQTYAQPPRGKRRRPGR